LGIFVQAEDDVESKFLMMKNFADFLFHISTFPIRGDVRSEISVVDVLVFFLKLIGILLSTASIFGVKRLQEWENNIRRVLTLEKLTIVGKKLWYRFLDIFEAPILILQFPILLLCFAAELALIILVGNIYPGIMLQKMADTWVKTTASISPFITIFPFILLLAYLFLIFPLQVIAKNIRESRSYYFANNKPNRVDKIANIIRNVLLVMFFLPFFIVLAPSLLLALIPKILEKSLVFLRLLLEFFLKLIVFPYQWLDIQVKRRGLESTLVIIGVIITILGEFLSTVFK